MKPFSKITTVIALAFVAMGAVSGCQQASFSPEDQAINEPPVSSTAEPGDLATWEVLGGASADSTSLELGVTRLGCAGGKTGTVLTPGIAYESQRIIITMNVEPLDPDMMYTCQTNDIVPVSVDLAEPIGERTLVDGACLNVVASGTSFCEDPSGTRWP